MIGQLSQRQDNVPHGSCIREQKLRMYCDMCKGEDGRPRGLIWLGGKDYLECPNCFGKKVVEVIEANVTPPKHFIMPPRAKLFVPHRID